MTPTSTCPSCAATPATACRGSGASASKTAAQLIEAYGSLAGLRAAVDGGDPALKGARRANLEAASAYLDVAPTVVRVLRDAPVADVDLSLPREVADPELLEQLGEAYGVTNPVGRVLKALGLG